MPKGGNLVTHGLTRGGKPPEHYVWSEMIRRCHNPKHRRFADYGARGIVVCAEWRDSFGSFIEHIGWRPDASLTLDRIDNAKGYEPGNVRWATVSEQNKNRRMSIMVEHDGQTMCLKDYCRLKGLRYGTVTSRIHKYGWPLERAIDPTARKQRASVRDFSAGRERLG